MFIKRMLWRGAVFGSAAMFAVMFGAGTAFATTNCTIKNCDSYALWNGTTNGMASTFTVSNPNHNGSSDTYNRSIILFDSSGQQVEEMGIVIGYPCATSFL